MTSLADHQSTKSTKLLLIGNPGTGKTGSLVSLVKAGYKLRVLDFDNGLDSLATYVRKECPDKLPNVEFRSLRDKYKTSPSIMGSQVDGTPTAFTDAFKMLDRWKYDNVDLGRPADWDDNTVLVIDSSTRLGDAALNWATFMNPSAKDGRQTYGAAQGAFENMVALLTSSDFKPNVIMICHIRYMTAPDGSSKGFPTAVGVALGPTIPAYFNSILLMETTGTGTSIQRTIKTVPTATIDLKNPAPFDIAPALPIGTGLADFFAKVKGK